MDQNMQAPVPGAPAPIEAQPVPAAPVPAPAPAPVAPQAFAAGGEADNSNSISKWFEGITWLDFAMLALAAGAFIGSIMYYRQKIAQLKEEKTKTSGDIEEIKANMQSFLGKEYKSFT